MPLVAKTEKEQCTAFGGARGPRRCRLVARPGHTTCHIHRNYYRGWCDRNPPADHWNDLTRRQQAEYSFQVSRGLVEIPADQIALLRLSQVDYYTLFMRYTDYSPTINMRCLTEYIFLRANNGSGIEDYMLKDVDTCYIVFKSIILRSIIMRQDTPAVTMLAAEVFLSRPVCRQLVFSAKLSTLFEFFTDIIQIYAPGRQELYDLYEINKRDGIVQRSLRRAFSVHAATIKKRCAVYKEDLIAAAWKPQRIEKWLECDYDVFAEM